MPTQLPVIARLLSFALLTIGLVTAQMSNNIPDAGMTLLPNEATIIVNQLPGTTNTGTTGTWSWQEDPLTVYNSRELPELSNGILGTTVFNESIYMAGLYHSATSQGASFTTRVRIPNYAMFRFNGTDKDLAESGKVKRTYYFNVTKAVFEETIDTPNYYIRQIMVAHAIYSRSFITIVRITRKSSTSQPWYTTFPISTHHFNRLNDEHFREDFNIPTYSGTNVPDFTIPKPDDGLGFQRTLTVAQSVDQSAGDIIIYTNSPFIQAVTGKANAPGISVAFQANQDTFMFNYIQTVAPTSDQVNAYAEYKLIRQATDTTSISNLHTQAWTDRYKLGDIAVDGTNSAKLRRVIASSLYHIYSQFPFPQRLNGPQSGGTGTPPTTTVDDIAFSGVSACGLGRGGTANRSRIDFGGHVTPHQELFVFPAIAMFQPSMALYMLNYRARMIQSPSGQLPVPFESAKSGGEVIPAWCATCQTQALYNTGLLGLAIRTYHAITRDDQWLALAQKGGLDMLQKMAQSLDAKMVANQTRGGFYGISGVMGPDELHQNENNNLFTNVLVSLLAQYLEYARCLTNKAADQSTNNIIDHAKRLIYPYLSSNRFNEEFDGFNSNQGGKTISHPDGILASFPANYNMSGRFLEYCLPILRKNDLDQSMQNVQTMQKPMTAVAMDIIGRLELGTPSDVANAQTQFSQMIDQFSASPFWVWRNTTERYDASAANHLGTAAAFIQILLNGWGGLRIKGERLDILRPNLPQDLTSLTFKGLNFFGGEIDYNIQATTLTFQQSAGGTQFKTAMNIFDRTAGNQYASFSGSASKTLPTTTPTSNYDQLWAQALYSILPQANFNCLLKDANWNGQNPYYQSGSTLGPTFMLLLLTGLVAVLLQQK